MLLLLPMFLLLLISLLRLLLWFLWLVRLMLQGLHLLLKMCIYSSQLISVQPLLFHEVHQLSFAARRSASSFLILSGSTNITASSMKLEVL